MLFLHWNRLQWMKLKTATADFITEDRFTVCQVVPKNNECSVRHLSTLFWRVTGKIKMDNNH